MVEMKKWDAPRLVEAVLEWTGWGQHVMPRRDDSVLITRFGADAAKELLSQIKSMEDEFYSSDARYVAADLAEMGTIASSQFRKRHPEVPDEVVQAFAWCYTFDFK